MSVAQSLPVLTVAAATFATIFYLPPLFLAGAAAAAAGIAAEVMALQGVTPTVPRVGLGLVSWLPLMVPRATTSGDAIAVLACCYIVTVLLAARTEHEAAASGALIPAVVFSWICGYWALAPLLPLMALSNGHALVSLMILFTMLRNSGAYFLGDLVAGTPISPVNPRKTYVGAALALLFAAVLTAPVGLVMALPLSSMLAWFALLGILGQLGDLTGSLIKRMAGVSESGRLFPGHGGFLDAFDSFLFVVPGTYFYWARLA